RDVTFDREGYASSRTGPRARSATLGRLEAYLAAVAPIGAARVRARVDTLLESLPADVAPERAIAHAQEVVTSWWRLTFETDDVGELAARRALARHPDAFLGESPAELAALRSRRATFLAEVELPAQALSPTRGRALLGLVPPVALGALAALTFFE